MKRVSRILGVIVTGFLVIGAVFVAGIRAQTVQHILQPGESIEIVAATCETCPTCAVPTATLEPTHTPEPPTPTPTPDPQHNSYGVVRIGPLAWPVAADELGADFVEYIVSPSTTPQQIVAQLDYAQSLGLRVLFHLRDGSQNTDHPWYLVGDDWAITSWGISALAAVDTHPAIWGIYTLHEPWSSSEYDCRSDCQRVLYTFLKQYTAHPLYSDISTLARAEEGGEVLSDGMCDLCGIFPCRWPDINETLRRLEADYEVQRRLMPNSQIVVGLNVYDFTERYVMPEPEQLRLVRSVICEYGLDYLYYPWTGYERALKDVPELWPVIAEGCGDAPDPTSTHEPDPTEIPPATNTPTPQPTATDVPPTPTPQPGAAVVIDHNSAIPSNWDRAESANIAWWGQSVQDWIVDGLGEIGFNGALYATHFGTNGDPLVKIDRFALASKSPYTGAMMKFCPGDIICVAGSVPTATAWNEYRAMMIAEQAENPGTVMIWWTWPNIASNNSRASCNSESSWFNARVREYVAANGGVLFDYADIVSYHADGTACTYNGYQAMCPEYSTDGGHPDTVAGRQRVARYLIALLDRMGE